MKITFFIGGLIGGGAERVTCNLSNFLITRGHEIQILTMSDSDSYPLEKEVKRQSLLNKEERSNIVVNYIKRYSRLKKFLRSDNSDAYVVMLPITTIFLLLLRKYIKAPVIASERCYPAVLSQITQRLLSLLAKRADAWVFQTIQQKEWYGKAVSSADAKIIPNAINENFVQLPYNGERLKEIVAVGRLCPQKNYELLIYAFSRIAANFPEYKIIIYGEGAKRNELEDIINKHNLQGRILMPGYEKDISSKLKKACLYVLSSNYEGIPNTLMEAMALGVPAIATDCDGGGSRMLIENGVNGILVPKGDEKVLSDAMRKMLSDKDFAENCGKEAHKICERLAPERIYGEWESFIKEIVKCD